MTPLDVLVVESHAGTAQRQVAELERAGHRVHRCSEPGADAFPCRELTDPGTCPVTQGVDVALLVRRHVTPRPTEREQGIGCVLRSHVPLVEDGPSVLDPYADFVSGRITGDVVASCEAAAEQGYAPVRAAVRDRIAPLLAPTGFTADDVTCSFVRVGTDLRVHLSGPVLGTDIEQAVAVRVVDAVNAAGRQHGRIDVSYRAR